MAIDYEYSISISKTEDGGLADMYDINGNYISTGTGKFGPLDAASNAAIYASNVEYQALKDAGA